MEKVNVFAKLKKIKKYVYDPEANLFKPEQGELGKENDGYELYPDHDHYDYGENDYSKSYTGIQNNPLTKFLILGDFDKKFKAESVMENWHGMSYKSKISSDAQFLCSDENVNLIISEGLRFLEIGWKCSNDNSRLLHRCDDPEKDRDIYINLSNIASLLIYTSEIRRMPYKDGEPIKKYGSPETKVKLTEENAIKLMNEVDRQIKNVSGLLGKDFDLSDYNELCQKISETESEFKKCQNEWFNLLRRSDVTVEYAKYQDNGKKKDILYELTDIDKLKAKYRVECDVPFITSDKTIEENYCVWNRISKGRQQEFTKIDERQKPLKNKLNELKTQQQNVLNRISASSDNYHTEEKKRIEQLTKLMNIKSDVDKMIYSQISGNTKIDENNPIEVVKNVVPQGESTEENIDVPQTESQIKPNQEKENKNPEIDNKEDENIQDQNISNSEIIQQDNNTLNENQEEDSIQNDNNEDIGHSENTEEIQMKLNAEEKENKKLEINNKEEKEELEDLSKKLAEKKISSKTKQDDNSNVKEELATMIDEYQSSMMHKRQEDQQKRKERVDEFQRLQKVNAGVTYGTKTFTDDIQDANKNKQDINPEANTDKDNKMDSKSNIAQTDSKNSTDNAIVRFFKWLINKIRSWFGYPELWPLNNVKIPDKINSVGPEENQQLQNKNPKLEELSQDPNKQNKGI